MKMHHSIPLCLVVLCWGLAPSFAQDPKSPEPMVLPMEEEEGPSILRFEPDILLSMEERKVRIAQTRSILDTLDISEGKRRRLLKDLYKNGRTERLSKALTTATAFEDVN